MTLRYLSIMVLSLLSSLQLSAQISISDTATPYVQNFDGLPSAGDDVPFNLSNWSSNRDTIRVGTGSATTGLLYSFGSAASTDRALGSLTSANTSLIVFGANFSNATGAAVQGVEVAFTGEMWRKGQRVIGGNPIPDTLYFEYSLNATGVNDASASWIRVSALSFISPSITGTAGLRDGNAAEFRSLVKAAIPVNIASGANFFLRWNNSRFSNFDGGGATGAKDGLGIDDLSVKLLAEVEPPVCETPTQTVSGLTTAVASGTLNVQFNGVSGAEGYIVVLTKGDDFAAPSNGTTYTAGTNIVAGEKTSTVIGVGSATTAQFTGIEADEEYLVQVYPYNVCTEILYGTATSAEFNTTSTAVRNNVNGPAFTLYPNPAKNGFINARFGETVSGVAVWQLYNTAGAQVAAWRNTLQSNVRLALPSLPTGQYILMMNADGKIRTEKFIVAE